MSYNGSGTFNINTTGQPVVAGTIISAATFNALTADLATGLTTALTKDGQTATTARILFAQGINSTLVTDASSVSTGSIFTAGGVGIAKKLYVGTDANIAGTLAVTGVATFSAAPIYSSLTASSAVATDASKALVSVTNTGTGSNVLATAPTIASANLTTALTLAGAAGINGQVLTSAGSGLPTWASPSGGFNLKTPVTTTSGTSIDFTGIPPGVKQVVVMFRGVSIDGTGTVIVQIGDSGGIETTNYSSMNVRLSGGQSIEGNPLTTGFNAFTNNAGIVLQGSVTLTLENSSAFSWVSNVMLSSPTVTEAVYMGSGGKSLSAELDRVRITTQNGTDTFDAGEINIAYI